MSLIVIINTIQYIDDIYYCLLLLYAITDIDIFLDAIIERLQYILINSKRYKFPVDEITCDTLNVADLSAVFIRGHLRFNWHQMNDLFTCWACPAYLIYGAGNKVSGREALLMLIFHIAYLMRYSDMEKIHSVFLNEYTELMPYYINFNNVNIKSR